MSDVDTSDGGEEDQQISKESFNINKICSIICNNETTFSFLVEVGTLKSAQRSNSNCRRQMKVVKNSAKRDGALWRCSNCNS